VSSPSVAFEEYCAEHGIERQKTTPYTPQQNGVVERRNQIIVTMARSLLKSRNMPTMFWGEAVATAVFLLNRAPTKAVDGMTPYEAWHGRRPDVSFLRTFGCVAYVKATKPHLKKLDDHGTPVVFIGYERGTKVWRFYDPVTHHAVVSRDVVFDEPTSWSWKDEGEDLEVTAVVVMEYHTMELATERVDVDTSTDSPEDPATPCTLANHGAPVVGTPVMRPLYRRLHLRLQHQHRLHCSSQSLSRHLPTRRNIWTLTTMMTPSRGTAPSTTSLERRHHLALLHVR
jgi:hypothetical protein